MQISLNIKNEFISQQVLNFLSSFTKDEIEIKTTKDSKKSFCEFAGMWKDKDITIESLREVAWKK
jgi:hypothetical protein